MIIDRPNPNQVVLQVAAHNLDGTPKTSLAAAAVRVYHMSGTTEVEDLGEVALEHVAVDSNIWRYVWTPVSLGVGQYYAEYYLEDTDGAEHVDVEEIVIQDFAEETVLEDIGDLVENTNDITLVAQYGGAIHYNSLDGSPGQVVGENGTPDNPCRDEADAQVLAGLIGLRAYKLYYGAFTPTQNHDRWYFEGRGVDAHVKLDPTYTYNGSHFYGVHMSGGTTGNTGVVAHRCLLWPDLQNLWGTFTDCVVVDTLFLGAGDHFYQNCGSQASPYCTFDCQGKTVRVHVAGFNGEIHLKNFGPGSYADFDMASGKVTLESTCTGGIVEIRGETEFVNQTVEPNAPIIVNRAAVNQRDLIQVDVELIKQLKIGAWEIVANQMIYYDTDGNEIMRQNLYDINGFPTNGVNMYSREPV